MTLGTASYICDYGLAVSKVNGSLDAAASIPTAPFCMLDAEGCIYILHNLIPLAACSLSLNLGISLPRDNVLQEAVYLHAF